MEILQARVLEWVAMPSSILGGTKISPAAWLEKTVYRTLADVRLLKGQENLHGTGRTKGKKKERETTRSYCIAQGTLPNIL